MRSLITEFQIDEGSKEKSEQVKGTLYYESPDLTALHVYAPLDQWMILGEKEMLIFYPASQEAFHFTSSQIPFSMPFFQAFLAVSKEDYGLSKLGYTMDRHERKGAQFISYWKPPETMKNLGEFILTIENNRVSRLELKDPKGKPMVETILLDHRPFGSMQFPSQIIIQRHQPSESTEKVVFSSTQFNVPVPEQVRQFKLPAGVKPKEVAW